MKVKINWKLSKRQKIFLGILIVLQIYLLLLIPRHLIWLDSIAYILIDIVMIWAYSGFKKPFKKI